MKPKPRKKNEDLKKPDNTNSQRLISNVCRETPVYDSFPYQVAADYERFNQKFTVYNRTVWDSELQHASKILLSKIKGFNQQAEDWESNPIKNALCIASSIVNDHAAAGSQFGIPNQGLYEWNIQPNTCKIKFEDDCETSKIVKKAARFLGASLVGIAPYDQRWVYSELYDLAKKESLPAEFPFEPKSVVVLAFEMDKTDMKSAHWPESSVKGLGYSRMAETAYKVATFIRHLGYKAIPCGNDTALSVPYAVMAGLGEAGRNGLLVTQEYGSRVLLSKIFTELEIKPDTPISFGVKEFCSSCLKCALACPANAISTSEKMTVKGINISNCSGVSKWFTNAEKCFQYWLDNKMDCFACITACPYTKKPETNVDLAQIMDNFGLNTSESNFGFNKSQHNKSVEDWWK